MSKSSRRRYRRKALRGTKGQGGHCAACGKVCYRSPKAARLAIEAMIADGRADKDPRGAESLNAYYHWPCRSWHVGHRNPKDKQRRQAG